MMFRPLLMLSCGSVEVSHGKIRVRLTGNLNFTRYEKE